MKRARQSPPNNWYVVTGGPCCGKTTTVNMLAARGYKTTIEEARHYLSRVDPQLHAAQGYFDETRQLLATRKPKA